MGTGSRQANYLQTVKKAVFYKLHLLAAFYKIQGISLQNDKNLAV
jgi:hypothetical protein